MRIQMPILQRFYIFYVPFITLLRKHFRRVMEIEEIRDKFKAFLLIVQDMKTFGDD